MLHDPTKLVDWHWEQPCFPAYIVHNETAVQAARRGRLHKCFYCPYEILGAYSGPTRILDHTIIAHPGKVPKYTVYPPIWGNAPRGFDA